jgi:phenylalanyl-tRNA synthetase beta chain
VAQRSLAYDPALAGQLGGVAVAQGEQKRILAALGFGVDADGP